MALMVLISMQRIMNESFQNKYIAEPQGLEKNEYEFYIKALRPKETCWLGPMIMLKRSDGDICIRYSIKSNKSDGNLSGEIKFSVV